jgi:lipoprotein-anchoring transpeptidase ErfK/SrfK
VFGSLQPHRHRGGAGRRAALSASALAVVAVVGALAGCQSDSTSATQSASHSVSAHSSSTAPRPPATVSIVPAAAATSVPLDQPVTITSSGGTLAKVSVTDAAGKALPGGLGTTSDTWSSSAALAPDTTYRVDVTALNPAGVATTATSTFTTLKPTKVLGTKIAPLEDETVGVGMPIVVYFTAAVTDRAAVEKRLSLQESIPVEGAWHWYSDTEVHYRPQQYWPAGEQVTLTAAMNGVDAGKGVWGESDHVVHFQVGDSHITTVDAKTDMMTVTDNGTVVKTAPVSLGRDKYPTTSGIHVVLSKSPTVVMDSATVGIPKTSPDYYYETVLWDVRISWSGEFVHSAPWSVADQGHDNVSHGCVNASPAVAQWFYDFSRRGDIVSILNTPRPLVSGNGWTDWNMSWSDWLAGSALGAGSVPGTRSATPAPPADGGDAASASAVAKTQAPPKVTGPPVVTSTLSPTPTPSTSASPKPTVTPKPTPAPDASGSAKPTPTSSG